MMEARYNRAVLKYSCCPFDQLISEGSKSFCLLFLPAGRDDDKKSVCRRAKPLAEGLVAVGPQGSPSKEPVSSGS